MWVHVTLVQILLIFLSQNSFFLMFKMLLLLFIFHPRVHCVFLYVIFMCLFGCECWEEREWTVETLVTM